MGYFNPYPTGNSGEHGVEVVKWHIGKGKSALAWLNEAKNVQNKLRKILTFLMFIENARKIHALTLIKPGKGRFALTYMSPDI